MRTLGYLDALLLCLPRTHRCDNRRPVPASQRERLSRVSQRPNYPLFGDCVKVSGFTIARNAVKFGYPIEESLRSLLPLVDELVVGVGDGEDSTWDVVNGIGDGKIKPFRSVWDMSQHDGGMLLSEQTKDRKSVV